MPDIFLYTGHTNPNDIILSDPTVVRGIVIPPGTNLWTDPRDWVVGETVLTALLDAVSDDLTFLKTPTQARTTAGASTSTASTSLVDIASVTHTITSNVAVVEVIFAGVISMAAAGNPTLTLLIDGVNQGDVSWGLATLVRTAASSDSISFVFRTASLTAAAHVFKVQWKVSASTATLQAGWNFYVVER